MTGTIYKQFGAVCSLATVLVATDIPQSAAQIFSSEHGNVRYEETVIGPYDQRTYITNDTALQIVFMADGRKVNTDQPLARQFDGLARSMRDIEIYDKDYETYSCEVIDGQTHTHRVFAYKCRPAN